MEVKAAWKAVCFLLIFFAVTCSQTQGSVINLFDVLVVDIFTLAGLKVKICCVSASIFHFLFKPRPLLKNFKKTLHMLVGGGISLSPFRLKKNLQCDSLKRTT